MGEPAPHVRGDRGAHVAADAGEDGDADLIEAHERPSADAVDDDRVTLCSASMITGAMQPPFGVRRVRQDLDVVDLVVDDVDEREAGAASEVAGALCRQAPGELGWDCERIIVVSSVMS